MLQVAARLPQFPSLLTSKLRHLLQHAYSSKTIKSYNSNWNCWLKFCGKFNWDPLNVNEAVLSLFITYEFSIRQMKIQTIQKRISTISTILKLSGFHVDFSTYFTMKKVIAGATRLQGGIAPDHRLPLTVSHLRIFFQKMRSSNLSSCTARTMLAFGVFGMLRHSEYIVQNRNRPGKEALRFSDITFYPTFADCQMILLKLRVEKTLLTRKTDEVIIPATFKDVDPVHELKNLIHIRFGATPPPPSAFLFATAKGKPVDSAIFSKFLSYVCDIVKLPHSRITSHSLRIGGCTSLIEAGVGDAVIQLLGRWNSSAYRSYVRLNKEFLLKYSRLMCCSI